MFRQSFNEVLRDALGGGAIARAIRVFSEDESRFGLLPLRRRRITAKGVKPVGAVQHRFESFYGLWCS